MFKEVITSFKIRINSILETAPLSILIMGLLNKGILLEFKSFLDKNCMKNDSDLNEEKFIIPVSFFYQFRKIKRNIDNFMLANEQLPTSHFLNLLAQFDHFYGSLLRCVFKTKPEILKSIDKQVGISELYKYPNIEELREYFIEKEIDTVLRSSHVDQIEYLERKLNIKLTKELDIWPEFVEICERRNLLVHCDGTINQQYLNICNKYKCDIDKKELKEKLNVNIEYLQRSCFVLLEMGIKLAFVTWNKLDSSNGEDIADLTNKLIYAFIEDGHYKIAIVIAKFLLSNCSFKYSETIRLMIILNLAQSYKWSKNEKEKSKVLEDIDWKAKSVDYQLCHSVLINDFDSALGLMKEISTNGRIEKDGYDNWPIFQEFRQQPEYSDIYLEIFNESPSEIVKDAQIIENEINFNDLFKSRPEFKTIFDEFVKEIQEKH